MSVGNDVDVAVEAEAALGAGRSFRTLLGLWWGTGVGGAIIIDGKRWLGRGAAGEIGHTVVKLDGAPCPCGRRGCLEAYAGRGAMEQRARRAVKHGAKTSLFKLMENDGGPPDEFRLAASAGTARRARRTSDRACDSRPRRRRGLGHQPDRPRGGRGRRRPRHAAR